MLYPTAVALVTVAATPETHYAKSGDVHIAYSTVGEGPLDLVWVPAGMSHLEWCWEEPAFAWFLQRLASFCRLIIFDKRGTGLSDRGGGCSSLSDRMDDIRAVMDAAGSERAALLGFSEGGALTSLFAATYPDRTVSLVLWGSIARFSIAPDFPHGITPEVIDMQLRMIEQGWGTGVTVTLFGPSVASDQGFINWCARNERLSASPGAMEQLIRLNREIDIRYIFPSIRVPTLVMHRTGDLVVDVEQGRWLAEHIEGSRYVEFPGNDHLAWIGDAEAVVGEVEEFLTGHRAAPDADRVLATVLFTDIVDSTRHLEAIGDRRWRYLLDEHHARVRRLLDRFKGVEIDTAGDGFFATFDGPARAIRCACAIRDAVREIDLEIRAGLHTGEVEGQGTAIVGLAVHIGARVAALARASEVLVTSTVQALVLGSGIDFADRGLHDLKGVPDHWQLFAVEGLPGIP